MSFSLLDISKTPFAVCNDIVDKNNYGRTLNVFSGRCLRALMWCVTSQTNVQISMTPDILEQLHSDSCHKATSHC